MKKPAATSYQSNVAFTPAVKAIPSRKDSHDSCHWSERR
jgi:hypothetical protein